MAINMKFAAALVALICIGIGSLTNSAAAVTADVAKKCARLTQQAFPPRVVGNPAAGSATGSGLAEQDYYKRCVANGGNMADDVSK